MPPSRTFRTLNIAPSARRNAAPPPGPPSPTFSDATHASAMNFGANGPEKIITRANLKASLQAYEDLMNTSESYRAALLTMSKATADFADAMERCAGLKGPTYEAGTRLQAASGLHHLIGNHWHVLAETLDKKFEKPLRQHLDTYRTIVTERSLAYEKELHIKSQVIRDTEMRNMNKKERNLQSFREALHVLQRQVDDLDELKARHYQEIMEHEEEVWDVVQGKVCVVVRSTMDLFDKFTAKASDPVLELMLQSIPDPFDAYGPPPSDDQIFSILPPLSIMNMPSPSPSPLVSTPDREPTPVAANASWAPINGGSFPESGSQWADVHSPSSTPPRSASPPSVPRRHSVPAASSRKSESKLRTVLTVINENHSRLPSAEDPPLPESSSAPLLNGNTPPDIDNYWEALPHDETGEMTTTLRNSALVPSQSEEPPEPDTEPSQNSPLQETFVST